MPDLRTLDRAFNPRTVAVVGDKQGQGYFWLRSLKTFQGKVFSVQIDEREIPNIEAMGFPNYRSLLDIPDPIDYVVVSVPRAVSPKIVEDCIKKGVGGVTLFTSSFAETGTEEGRRVQELLTRMANEANLNLIGPNCMGIFNPKIGLRFNVDQYYGESGKVGFISQSGTHLSHMSTVGPLHGVKLSKGVSYGNAIALDSPDYLEYFAGDPETEIIGLYVEWVRDGQRFFRALLETAARKPVVVWKGGETEDGARAAFSHTAALAQSPLIWKAMVRQAGALWVNNLEEMLDTLKALLYLKPPQGNRMGLIAMSGGQSVVIADAFARAGFKVPALSSSSYEELVTFFDVIGGSYKNPFDISWQLSLDRVSRILNILDRDPNIDCVGVEVGAPFLSRRWEEDPGFLDRLLDILVEFKERSPKPLLVILTPAHLEAVAMEAREKINARNIPNFPTFERAAAALKRVLDFYQRRQRTL